jgi:alpha-maltose-1-phosphate synthase
VPYDPAQADDRTAIAAFEEDFANKINLLTRDPEKARAFGLAGRQRCIEEFDWSKIAAETVDVYRRALEVHQG